MAVEKTTHRHSTFPEILMAENMPAHKTNTDRQVMFFIFKKYFQQVLFLILALIMSVPSVQADARIVRVGVYENAPKVFTNESGTPSGIFIDIIKHIAETEGWDVKYVSGTWTEGLDRLKKGEIDLMPDVAYTADRNKIYSFHKVPVLSSWYQVYAPRGHNIRSILDLNGKKLVVLNRSVQQAAFAHLSKGFGLNVTLIPMEDYKQSFEMVAAGKADAAITNKFYGNMHSKKYRLEDTAVVFEPSDLFFAAPKNINTDLLNSIDHHLSILKKAPQSLYYTSLKHWTSEEIPFQIPVWLKILLVVIGILLPLTLIGSMILKHQVNERTRELKTINEEMEQRIIQRTEELAVATEKAQSADRLKSAFLASMSHELRTPLNSIIGFTGMVLQGLAGPLNEEQTKQLAMVRNSAHHLLNLINDVLDISKIEAGQLVLMSDNFNLKESIENTMKIVSPLAAKKNVRLYSETSDNISEFHGDKRRIEQIMINLLGNAIKFTDTGDIRLRCHSDDNAIVLSVEDTGIGIKQDNMDLIFETFRQIDTGIARVQEGSGLGLNITKKLVEKMGGSIRVKSEWGKGSTFTVILPKRKEE